MAVRLNSSEAGRSENSKLITMKYAVLRLSLTILFCCVSSFSITGAEFPYPENVLPADWGPGYTAAVTDVLSVMSPSQDGGTTYYLPQGAAAENRLTGDLLQVTGSGDGNTWKNIGGRDKVLVSTICNYPGYDRATFGQTGETQVLNTYGDVWVALEPERSAALHALFPQGSANTESVQARMLQYTGIPTAQTSDRVVEMFVDPTDKNAAGTHETGMFRPTPNVEISAQPTNLEWSAGAEAAWEFGGGAQKTPKQWIIDNSAHNFGAASVPPYPWTGLGYTYDWGEGADDNHRGGTEFILSGQNNTASVSAVVSTGSYLYAERGTSGVLTGDFRVWGWADTIWAGSLYTGVDDAESDKTIEVASTGRVEQGVLAGSTGFTLVNAGTISGPRYHFDKSIDINTVLFHHDSGAPDYDAANFQGTLANTGTIISPGIAVEASMQETTQAAGAIAMRVTNAAGGTIQGGAAAIRFTGGTTDAAGNRVDNYGTIRGDVLFVGAAQNELAQHRGALLEGTVSCGTGGTNVALHGGTLAGGIRGDATNTAQVGAYLDEGDAVVHGTITDAALAFQAGANPSYTLWLNAATTNTTITVAQAGNLGGNLLTTAGIDLSNSRVNVLRPGAKGAIGVISTTGDVVFGTEDTLEVEVAKPTGNSWTSDCVRAANTTLEGNAKLHVGTELGKSRSTVKPWDSFVVGSASGTMTGENLTWGHLAADRISTESDFLVFGAKISGKQLLVTVSEVKPFEDQAIGAENRAMAHALDLDKHTASGEFGRMLADMQFLTAADMNATLGAMNPKPYASFLAATRRVSQAMTESMADAIRRRRGGDRSLAAGGGYAVVEGQVVRAQAEYGVGTGSNRRLFARPFGLFYQEAGDTDRTGFQSNSAGVEILADRRLSRELLAGWGVSYADTYVSLDDAAGRDKLRSLRTGPYFSWRPGAWAFDGIATYGYHHNSILRSISYTQEYQYDETFSDDFDGNDLSVYFSAMRDFRYGRLTLTPIASLLYLYYHPNAMAESGAGAGAFAWTGQDLHSLRQRLGVELTGHFGIASARLLPTLAFGWAHDYLADGTLDFQFVGGNSTFQIDMPPFFRDSAYVDLDLTLATRNNATLGLQYHGEFAAGGNFHAVGAGAKWVY